MKLHSVPRSSPPKALLKKLPSSPGARPFKRRSLSRGLYICLLLALAGTGAYALADHLLYWRAQGVVDLGAVPVAAESPGRLVRILVAPGDRVERGAVLAVFTNAEEQAEMLLAQAAMDRIEAEIQGERERAKAGARVRASFDSTEATNLRQKALAIRAERVREREQISSLVLQIEEVKRDLNAVEGLVQDGIVARSEKLELRLQLHELNGRAQGLRMRQAVLVRNENQLEWQAGRLDHREIEAQADGVRASQIASLRAQQQEAHRQFEVHETRARFDLLAPVSGTISWVDAEPGQVVAVGAQVVQLVPVRPATVIAYPGEHLEHFPPGCKVMLEAPGFRARGLVLRGLAADHAKPGTMLKPYEREVVGPTLLIEVTSVLHGQARDGIVVTLERPRFPVLDKM